MQLSEMCDRIKKGGDIIFYVSFWHKKMYQKTILCEFLAVENDEAVRNM